MSRRLIPPERLASLPTGTQGLDMLQVESGRGHGFNDIVAPASGGWLAVARDSARDPMLWFLLLTASLFGVLGQLAESLTLLIAAVPLLGMDAYLHRRACASSAALASRLASSAKVLRDGQWRSVPSRELVPGDLVEVAPGEYFPADGLLVGGSGLQTDESTLTGESLSVAKRALDLTAVLPDSAPDEQWGIAGTRLLTGTARMRIAFIGGETRYGEIARSALEGIHAATPLQKAISELVGALIGMAVVMCVCLATIRLWHGHGWVDALLSALTLAVAALPEEFPVIYTFFLGVGVFRLARRKALVRRAVAVENIGRITCIVSDKTGTITARSLVLAHRAPAHGFDELAVLQVAAFASRPDSGDPLDQALLGAAGPLPTALLLADFPFTEARRRETVLLRRDGKEMVALTKGAPETVLAMSDAQADERAGWLARVETYASTGHKVIGCARCDLSAAASLEAEPGSGFRFAGLLAFEDPVREGVREAVAECMAAGIRVLMVTGDHPATAVAIAREIGLGGGQPGVLTLAPSDVAGDVFRRHNGVHVVARATPPQKLDLVQALQEQGELVAVTGDGVDDAPALRLADIGVAMGERGTQSAREVAPVVLLDDNFRTIVAAVAQGRQLFRNLRLAFAYLLLVHLPLVLGAAVIPLMDQPLLFLPIHIVWLELVVRSAAMLSFQDLPRAGPLARVQRQRDRRPHFFSADDWLIIAVVGGIASAAVAGSYFHALGVDREVEHARAMAMGVLLAFSAGVTSGLTRLREVAARWIVVITLLSAAAVVQIPRFSRLLHLQPLHAADWALVAAAFTVSAVITRRMAKRFDRYTN